MRRAWERPERVTAQVLELGDWADVRLARSLLGDTALQDALKNAPPGVLSARSWNFWNLFFHIVPVPPLPQRPLPP